MRYLLFIILLSSTSGFAQQNEDQIKAFSSDGCSSFPDGTLKQQNLWLSCCTEHDLSYWAGGTYDQRLAADQQLRRCVAEINQPKIAEVMFLGVRLGGSPFFPTRFRWGYGWPFPRGYRSLTQAEQAQVDLLRPKLDE